MCGRYALALRLSQIRRMLEDDNMPVYEAPEDPYDENDEDAGGRTQGSGDGDYSGPRQSYNFAPGYRGVVYRADVPDHGAGPRSRRNGQDGDDAPPSSPDTHINAGWVKQSSGADQQQQQQDSAETVNEASDLKNDPHYKLQTMKWGLVPFWTKRNPGYGSMMKTINCRDDSLAQGGGMWSSMKARKRCVAVAQGFYEWLKKDGGREKMPHYVKRKDGKLMCFAGLWDVVRYEDNEEKLYTYTIITTDSNKQLNFLHDRMPVILENGSEKMRKWLDPKRYEWSKELQSLLIPYEGELEVYPVSKDVGKVGNNSPSFIIPVDSKENKANIANFFAKGGATTTPKKDQKGIKEEGRGEAGGSTDGKGKVEVEFEQPEIEISARRGFKAEDEDGDDDRAKEPRVKREDDDDEGNDEVSLGKNSPPNPKTEKVTTGIKREATQEESIGGEPSHKKLTTTAPNKKDAKPSPRKGQGGAGGGRQKISATSNSNNSSRRSPTKASAASKKAAGTQKITKFFANSS